MKVEDKRPNTGVDFEAGEVLWDSCSDNFVIVLKGSPEFDYLQGEALVCASMDGCRYSYNQGEITELSRVNAKLVVE
jgi:hypothetical protein